MQDDGALDINMQNEILIPAIEIIKEKTKEYITNKKHKDALSFIDKLKKEKLYPYKKKPKNKVEKVTHQAFDIIALNVSKHLPDYNKTDNRSKLLMFELIKEAIENKSQNLKNVLLEVLKLPKNKIDEFSELLEKVSLTNVISTATLVTNRIKIISGIRQIFDDKKIRDAMLERKHFQKIIQNETWLFGDDYTNGVVADQKLTTVLKRHLEQLGRDDFQEIIANYENDELKDIPDLCLFKSFNLGKADTYKNLVIELKRPSTTLNTDHLSQIKRYAFEVSSDSNFDKNKTEWTFYLLGKKMNKQLEAECTQKDRKFGHFTFGENINIYVILWDRLLDKAEARHNYIIKSFDFKIEREEEGIDFIKQQYSDIFKDVNARIDKKNT